jgi:UrcA family protein
MRSLITVLSATILACSAAPALAEDAPSVVVSYKDLNLAAPEGRRALETRIAAAVETVCGRAHRASVQQGREWAECRALTAAAARQKAKRVIAQATTVQVASAD